ncbi:right-handed parallel beta-helix repeat-containing protein [Pacificimonas sp. WHA3]|uniref:Right-handed parallel beta-helix repeat-containing protein n=1 Tax=Pacificimonas pallii TaxID=2827236 RepID=A0ABS6SC28_9SPHN|nr:right-handed parallel beta-helix repeat-containing protein [Pacificimonas pallii]MBV7255934.1 right-handed parallel beta-helix repeat-containing protein [Pacificimonas pallii]
MGRQSLSLGAFALLLFSFAAEAATLNVGIGRAYTTLPAAAAAAKSGDVIEVDAGVYTQGAVWTDDRLTIRAAPGAAPGSVIVRGGAVLGKALFVTKGADITIDGLRFEQAFVPDRNGAGIRMEGRNLTVLNSSFGRSEMGILVGSRDEGSTLTVRNTDFSDFYTGGNAQTLNHALYVGNSIGELIVEDSTFNKVANGHYIKSRANRTTIRGNIIDGRGGGASYLIDVPEGGQLVVENNDLIKGAASGNRTAIALGFERHKGGDFVNPDGFVFIGDNRFTNYWTRGTVVFFENKTGVDAELHENTLTVAAGRVELARGKHFVTREDDQITLIDALPIGSLPPADLQRLPARLGTAESSPAVAVPAPGTLGLLCLGLGVVLAGRRRSSLVTRKGMR